MAKAGLIVVWDVALVLRDAELPTRSAGRPTTGGRIVVVLRHPFFLKNFAAVIAALRQRGHWVSVVFSEAPAPRVGDNLADDVRSEQSDLPIGHLTPSPTSANAFAEALAATLDVRRYREKAYAAAPKLRSRARRLGSVSTVTMGVSAAASTVERLRGPEAANAFLRRALDRAPPDPRIVAWLERERPDLLLVSPLTPIGSEQVAHVLAARSLGIRVVYCMYSWDNLSNKGLLRPYPDAGIVWNQWHVDEAVTLHGMPREAMRPAGAPGYDVWFTMRPGSHRADFCRKVGLDPDRPFVLYTCSSGFVGDQAELPFVERWLTTLRASPDPSLAGLGVLIRPHPQHAKIWSTSDFTRFGNVSVYPKAGAVPYAGSDRTDYFDSIHHSIGVIGINTSAMVEAAILDRPVMTIADPSYSETQDGTLHFRHLQEIGFLQGSNSIDENVGMLGRLLADDPELRARVKEGNRRFVSQYLRPGGIDRPAADVWADAIEAELDRKGVARPAARPSRRIAAVAAAGVSGGRVADVGLRAARYAGRVFAGPDPADPQRRSFAQRALGAARYHAFRRARPVLALVNPKFRNVRDTARLKGPFRLLVDLAKAFDTSASPPAVLVLGDSVHYRVSFNDRDSRQLGQMILDGLPEGSAGLALSYSAYQPAVFDAFLVALGRMRSRPRVVVLPINIRCFSPQWWLHPHHQFREEIAILTGYQPGAAIPEVVRPDWTAAMEQYDAMPADFGGGLSTIGGFRMVAKAVSQTDAQKRWREQQLAIFHYLYRLEPGHPRLGDAVRMVQRAAELGIRPLVYLTPINHMQGTRAAGAGFLPAVRRNAEIVGDVLAAAVAAAGGEYRDWSLDFPQTLFFHPGEQTEHLNEAGRRDLAARVTAGIGRLLR